ncbi:MAG: hypothetical protein WCR06_08365 [bacterium]
MHKLILTVVAVLGGLTFVCAGKAGVPAVNNRSPEWKINLVIAVNDATKAAGAMQAMPAVDRAAFAADVLGVLQIKRNSMVDKPAWAAEFASTAAALVTGAGEANLQAVLPAIAAAIVHACATGGSHELTKGDLNLLGVLTQSIMSQLRSEDRVAFATALLLDVDQQNTPDDAIHKLAVSKTSDLLLAGAGNDRAGVLAVVVKLGIPPPPPPPSSPPPPKPPTLPVRPPSGYQNQGIN